MSSVRSTTLAAVLVLSAALPASADVTGFLGVNTTPETRRAQGFSVGAGLLLLGFEFEYANTVDDVESGAPALRTYMGNVLLQTPFAILGVQPYVTTGAGVFRETLGETKEAAFALNSGAGVKVNLVGPLRLRVDYRVFKLGSGALYSPAHRVYAGINLKF